MWIPLLLSAFLKVSCGLDQSFPPWFKFGTATSSYQIEGAWNHSDRGESIWDRTIHSHPQAVVDGVNGDVACDSFHQWRRDVQMVHEMGLNFYRFSISWPRLLPNAFPTKISKTGKKYYNDLIDALLEKGIEPIITLYHWDLPQKLQDLGGWTNPLISDWFADFTSVVFSLYADRVKTWITINEPNLMCDLNYNLGLLAPMIIEPEMAALLCNKHVLIAHAKAWRIYDKHYKPKYHGKLSIANHVMWIEGKSGEENDVVRLTREISLGLYFHPIYSKAGGWPPQFEHAMAQYSKKAGYPRSKLPAFTKEEISLVRGTHDYYGLNYYTARIARWAKPGDDPGVWFTTGYPDLNIIVETDPKWPVIGHALSPSYPEGLRKSIAWLRQQYGDGEFFITENGCGDPEINDQNRMNYIKQHLEQVQLSMKVDGANVTAYTYWSLMDNFEWFQGYSIKFGLFEVDFEEAKRRRVPRASASYYARVATKRSLGVAIPEEFHRHHTISAASTPYFHCVVICIVICTTLWL